MSARKFLYVAPILALLTTGSTVWAYTCYFDYNTSPVGPKAVGTPCKDLPSGITMFNTSVFNPSGFPITYQIEVAHSNVAALPNSLNFTAFGFNGAGTFEECGIYPARTVWKSAFSNGTTQLHSQKSTLCQQNGVNVAPGSMSVYHYN
jgi:hypothetical protein